MYHPKIIERRLAKEKKRLGFELERSSIEECVRAFDYLEGAYDPVKKRLTRKVTDEEKHWIQKERVLCLYDFNYWAPRYAFLTDKGQNKVRLNFWESQLIAIENIAKGEVEAWKKKNSNLWCWLKARQLGATQVCESMIAHRLFFYTNEKAIIASDKPETSLELSRRVKYMLNNLPWWMAPEKGEDVKGAELVLPQLNNILRIGHGRLKGGGLAQGSNTSIFHLTEIPDWENWQQIDEDFLPTVPRLPTAVGWLESTARGRDDHWASMFNAAWNGDHDRLTAFFIPYYLEINTYRKAIPDGWKPSEITLAHAAKVERQSPLYCNGRTVRLTPEQLCWWQSSLESHQKQGRAHIHFQEYCSDHFECFASAGSNLFSADLINELRTKAVPAVVFELLEL